MNKGLIIGICIALLIIPTAMAYENWYDLDFPYRKAINISNVDSSNLIKYHTLIISGFNTTNTSVFDRSNPDNMEIVCEGNAMDVIMLNETDLMSDNFTKTYDSTTGWGTGNTSFMFRLPFNITAGTDNTTGCYVYYGNLTFSSVANNKSQLALIYDDFNRANTNTIDNGWEEVTVGWNLINYQIEGSGGAGKIQKLWDIGSCGDCVRYEIFTSLTTGGSSSGFGIVTDGYGFNFNYESASLQVVNQTGVFIKNTTLVYTQGNNYTFHWRAFDNLNVGDFSVWVNGMKINWSGTNNSNKEIGSREFALSIPAATGDEVRYIMAKRYIETEPTITFLSEDSDGILYDIIEDSNSHTETEENTITLYVSKKAIPTTNATLFWNNTNYGAGIRYKVNSTTYKFVNTFAVPTDAGNSSGNTINYIWEINSDGVGKFNVTGSQIIYDLGIDDCSSNTIQILNYTMVDEGNRSLIKQQNATIKATVTLTSLSGAGDWNYSTSVTNHTLGICLTKGVLNSSNFTLDAIVEYTAPGYVTEFNYIDNYLLTNKDSVRLQHIYLHALAEVDSTSFWIILKDGGYNSIEGAIVDVWRYYVDTGTWRSIEHSKTNEDGETILHLVSEDVIYKYFIRNNGSLLYTTPPSNAICPSSPCTINLQLPLSLIQHPDFYTVGDLTYSISFNKNTRTSSVTFLTQSGANAIINISTWQVGGARNETVCSSQLISNIGTVDCVVPVAYSNSTYYVEIYKDNKLIAFYTFSLDVDQFNDFGGTRIIAAGIFVLTLVMVAATSSVIAAVVFAVIGFIVVGVLQLVATGSFVTAGGSIMLLAILGAVLLIIKLTGRRSQ